MVVAVMMVSLQEVQGGGGEMEVFWGAEEGEEGAEDEEAVEEEGRKV